MSKRKTCKKEGYSHQTPKSKGLKIRTCLENSEGFRQILSREKFKKQIKLNILNTGKFAEHTGKLCVYIYKYVNLWI